MSFSVVLKGLFIRLLRFLRVAQLVHGFSFALAHAEVDRLGRKHRCRFRYVPQGEGGVRINGPRGAFKIGEGSHLKSDTFIDCSGGVEIGKYFHPGRGLTIFSTSHVWKGSNTLPYSKQVVNGPVKVGDGVWVGANVTLLPGVEIGDGAIIGAGSVVTKAVPVGAVVAGSPAVQISERDNEELRKLLIEKAFI